MKTQLLTLISLFLLASVASLPMTSQNANREMHYRMNASDKRLNDNVRLSYIDSLCLITEEVPDSLLFFSADIAYSSGNFKKTIDYTQKVLNQKNLPPYKHCNALYMLAKAYFKCDDDANAIDACHTLLKLPKPDSLLYHDINCLTMMNNSLSGLLKSDSIYDKELILTYTEKAEEILRHSKERNLKKETINNMRKAIIFSRMTIAIDKGNYEEALKYGVEMLEFPVSRLERLALEGNMAMIYHCLGDLEMAAHHYENVLSEKAWHTNHAVCLGNYMIMLNNSGRAQDAVRLFDSHSDAISIVKNQNLHACLLSSKGYALFNLGEYKKACESLFDAHVIADSIHRESKAQYTIKLLSATDSLRDYSKIKTDNAHKDKIIIWLIISVISLLVGIMMMAILLRKKKNRHNDIIRETEPGPDQHLPDSHTQDTTDTDPDNDASVKALHIASLNETITNISSTIDNSGISDQEKLSQINAMIKEVSSYDDLWEIFHIQFEKLHPSFFHNLMKSFPDLTQGEVRMCAYVMLNMSNKEIAALTRRNIRSVETMRYRLSKKMQLEKGESLISRLLTLSPNCGNNTSI